MKYTLITGASNGIGREFAVRYAATRHALILVARTKEKLESLAKELKIKYGVQVETMVQDLSRPDAAEMVYNHCVEKRFEVDFLINNAGCGWVGHFEDQPIEKLEEMVNLNVLTLTKLCYLFLPKLKTHKGMILNVASHGGFQPVPYMSLYTALKSSVLHFSEALSEELRKSGVKVIALAPGATETNFYAAAHSSIKETRFRSLPTEKVVDYAIKCINRGKTVIVPGWWNRLSNLTVRLSPRALVVKISAFLMRR